MRMTFMIRWGAVSILTFVILFTESGIKPDSLYAGIIVAILIGFVNAVIPFIIDVFSFSLNVISLAAFTLASNAFLLFILHELHIGIVSRSSNESLLIALMISIVTWFTTLATDSKIFFLK